MVRQLPNAIEIIPLSMVLGNCLVSLFSRSCCNKKATRSIVSRVAMPRSVASVSALFRRATTTRKKRTGSDSRNTSKLLQPVVTFLPPRTGRHTVLCSGARCAVGWEARTTGKCLSGRRTRRTSTGCVAAQGPAAVGGEGLRTGNFLSGRDAVPGALRPRGRSAGTDQPLLLRSF